MTIPTSLKIAALIVTIVGLLVAIELANITDKQIKATHITSLHRFSIILGYFPALVHRLFPKANLTLGRSTATKLDQTWFSTAGPKGLSLAQMMMAKMITDFLEGKIKIYLTIFLLTTTLGVLLALI